MQDVRLADKSTQSLADSRAIRLLALSCVKGLGDQGIAHVLAQVRRDSGDLDDFYQATVKRLRSYYGLRGPAADSLRRQADRIRERATGLLARIRDLEIVLLAPGDPGYPKRLDDFYQGEPPLLYARGNLRLLDTYCTSVLNSAAPTSQALEFTLGLASRLVEAGRTLLAGTESPAYNLVGLACKRAAGSAIVVLHNGLLASIADTPDRELVPLARFIDEAFDRRRTLLLSPFRPQGRWQKGNGPRRDRLIAALSETIVAVEIRTGGIMEKLCREAIRRGRRVFVCQYAERQERNLANEALIADGATPLVGDSAGSEIDLVLAAGDGSPAASATLLPVDDLERRRALGQFFTPPEVAEFMLKMVEIMRGKGLAATARIIDPACGEGVFLRVAAGRGARLTNLFGVDIDESLVPLWQGNAHLRGARLFRSSGLLDNPSIGLAPGSFDLVIGNPPFSGKGLKELLRLLATPGGERPHRERNLFDEDVSPEPKKAEAASPPLAPHERAILDSLARQLTRYMCWRLRQEPEEGSENGTEDGGNGGGLFADLELSPERSVHAADYEKMARLIAGWPADRTLDPGQPGVRDTIRRLASTAIEVFFTERFVQLAKPGGMIAVIVPESILASDQLAPLRGWLMQQIQLLAVVSLPQKVFTGVGANARTGIVFARRYTAAEQEANRQAEVAPGGQRMTAELQNSRVIMVAPDATYPNWTLQEYLAGILDHARKHRSQARKAVKT